jgi:hypothetical protein
MFARSPESSDRGAGEQASRTSASTASEVARSESASTLASLHRRAPAAISASPHRPPGCQGPRWPRSTRPCPSSSTPPPARAVPCVRRPQPASRGITLGGCPGRSHPRQSPADARGHIESRWIVANVGERKGPRAWWVTFAAGSWLADNVTPRGRIDPARRASRLPQSPRRRRPIRIRRVKPESRVDGRRALREDGVPSRQGRQPRSAGGAGIEAGGWRPPSAITARRRPG